MKKRKIYSTFESFINERSIRLEDLPSSSYLSKSRNEDQKRREFNRDKNALTSMIADLSWPEIEFKSIYHSSQVPERSEIVEEQFEVVFPARIVNKHEEMVEKYGQNKMAMFKKLRTVILIEENNFNRIHFALGVPEPLKGIGLGFNIYRALIDMVKFASSEDLSATDDAKKLWLSIISKKSVISAGEEVYTDLHVVVTMDRVLVMVKEMDDQRKLEIFTDWIEKLVPAEQRTSRHITVDDDLKPIVQDAFPGIFDKEGDESTHSEISKHSIEGDIQLGDVVISSTAKVDNIKDNLFRVLGKESDGRYVLVPEGFDGDFMPERIFVDGKLINARYIRHKAAEANYEEMGRMLYNSSIGFIKSYGSSVHKLVKVKAMYIMGGSLYLDVYPFYGVEDDDKADIVSSKELNGPMRVIPLSPAIAQSGAFVACHRNAGPTRAGMVGELGESDDKQEYPVVFQDGKEIHLHYDLLVKISPLKR